MSFAKGHTVGGVQERCYSTEKRPRHLWILFRKIIKKRAHFALLISGGAAEDKLMFMYRLLKFSNFKSLVSQMGMKWKYLI